MSSMTAPNDAAQHLELPGRRHGQQLVGRDRERELLRKRFEEALAGYGSIVLIAGEPGIGKTLLLDEFAQHAEETGAIVLRGGMSEDEGMPPYLPFLEAMGQYVRNATPETLGRQLGHHSAILGGILPEISVRLPLAPDLPPLPAEQAHLRLFEAVAQLLRAIAMDTPLVLALDDLHWSDRSSLALLSYIARHLGHARILVLGAFREDQSTFNEHFERTISDLHRRRMLTTVHLGPLSEDGVAALAESQLRGDVDARLRSDLFSKSEGNPFFAEELIYRWLETGAISNAGGTWSTNMRQDDGLPRGIISALRQRLVGTPPEIVELLRIASIIGRTFDLRLLAALAQRDAEEVEDQIVQASRFHLIETRDNGSYAFCHDMIRKCLYSEVSTVRRRRLHTAIASLLEPVSSLSAPHDIAALAFHYSRSDDRDKGVMYSLRAAASARATYAVSDAAAHCQTALRLLDYDDQRRGDLLLQLADAQLLAGDLAEAFDSYEHALGWWRLLRDRQHAARAIRGCAAVRRRTGALDVAESLLHDGLAEIGDEPGPERIRLLVELATLVGIQFGRLEDGLAYAQEASEAIDAEGEVDTSVIARAGCARGSLLVHLNRPDEGIAALTASLAVAGDAGDLAEETRSCSSLTQALFWMCRIQEAERVSWRRQRSAHLSHDPFVRCHAYAWLSLLHAAQGKWSRAEILAEESRSLLRDFTSSGLAPSVDLLRGYIAFQQRNHAAATLHLQLTMRRSASQEPAHRALALGILGVSAAFVGEPDRAEIFVADLESLLNTVPSDSIAAGAALAALAIIGLARGDDDQIDRQYLQLLKFEGQFHLELVDYLLARIEMRRSAFEEAALHLKSAEATARREDLRPQLAFVLETRAELLVITGASSNIEAARRILSQTLGLFRELDLSADAQRIERRLAAIAKVEREPSAVSEFTSVSSLSPRELEILTLVVNGMTNREIAAKLFLSEKTVANHMTSIFNKTSTNNRAGATAFALRRSLVDRERLDDAHA